MVRNCDYQGAFDIIGPVMMGPSSSHAAGAVRIGNSARAILGGIPKDIEIHYYELFAQTRQGHGTDVAIVGGAMGYSTLDNRIKSSLEIATDGGIKIDIVEEEGDSINRHPNCACIRSFRNDGRCTEIIGISVGSDTIKVKGIHMNGLEVGLNRGLPILVVDGNMTRAQINHLVNDINDIKLDCRDGFIMTDEDKCLVVIPLSKAISGSTLDTIKEKYSNVNVSYIN